MAPDPHNTALPPGWAWTTLTDVAELVRGVSYDKADSSEMPKDGLVPILRATNIQDDQLITDAELVFVPNRYIKPTQLLKPDDIVVCMSSGSKHLVGKTAQLHHEWHGSFGTFCGAIRFNSDIDAKFGGYYFQSPAYRNFIRKKSSGININNLRHSEFEELEVPLAPLAEQRRIVAKIEELFTRLDAGVKALKRVQAALKRYKASVLKAACEGRLVPQDPSDEPADVLLARILAERRAKWEADLRAKGKDPAKAKYEEPVLPDTSGLPKLPSGWVIASMDQLTTTITSGSRAWSKYYGKGSGTFIMAQNVRLGRLDLVYRQSVDPPLDDSDRVRSQVRKGDLLVTIVGANTGDVCRVPIELPEHYVCQSVALMRPVDEALSEFIGVYMVSPENGQHQYERYIYGAGRPHLSFDQLKMTAVLVPPVTEQCRIVAEVERRLSVVAALETTVDANLARAARLRQAILHRAFTGRLVPQDPGDEPAERLLERIRQGAIATPMPAEASPPLKRRKAR